MSRDIPGYKRPSKVDSAVALSWQILPCAGHEHYPFAYWLYPASSGRRSKIAMARTTCHSCSVGDSKSLHFLNSEGAPRQLGGSHLLTFRWCLQDELCLVGGHALLPNLRWRPKRKICKGPRQDHRGSRGSQEGRLLGLIMWPKCGDNEGSRMQQSIKESKPLKLMSENLAAQRRTY